MTTLIAVLAGVALTVATGLAWGENLADLKSEEREKKLHQQLSRISTPVVVVEIKELGNNAR